MADDYASIVEQAYINEVGRPSDPEGAAYWTGLLESGAITPADLSALFSGTSEGTAFDQAAGNIAGNLAGLSVEGGGGGETTGGGQTGTTMSPTVQSQMADTGGITSLNNQTATAGQVTPTTSPELRSFLESKYQSEFGRPFDAAGLDYWADQIQKGNVTQDQVASIFSQSPEGLKYDISNLAAGKTTDVGYISPDMMKNYIGLQSAYQTNLYRPGDVEGMKYWLSNPTDYTKAIGGSDEAFVQKTYRDTLKYAPDDAGLKYWMGQLASGAVTRAGLPTALANAAKQKAVTNAVTPSKSVVDPRTGIRYSSSSELANAYNFGNFPLTTGTRTNEDGSVSPTIKLNLPQRQKVSLGIKAFSPFKMTDYSYDPSNINLFGGSGASSGKSISLFGGTGDTSAATTGNEKPDVVKAARGGMISSDPVMRRMMFREGGPVSSAGTGITSNVTSPEENAKALQNMFAPGFRKGGEVQYFQEGGEAIAGNSASSGENTTSYGGGPIYDQIGGEPPIIERPPSSAIGNFFRSIAGQPVFKEPNATSSSSEDNRQAAARQMEEREMYRQAAEDEARYRGMTPPAETPSQSAPAAREDGKPPVKDRLSIRLDELKAEREANKEKRRENQLLALMQAGFAAAAGRSRNAITNIAAGGISGVQTLAELQKDTRAEDRALRREILETELTQERLREAAAERRAAREQTAAERQRSLLQNVSSNTRQEISSINQIIATEEAKLLAPAITEEQKAPIKAEIARLKNQRDAAVEQMYNVYESLGIKRPRTVEQESAGFKFLGAKK